MAEEIDIRRMTVCDEDFRHDYDVEEIGTGPGKLQAERTTASFSTTVRAYAPREYRPDFDEVGKWLVITSDEDIEVSRQIVAVNEIRRNSVVVRRYKC